MFLDRLLNQGGIPVLERTLQFTAARHRLIAQNIVNVDTPNYRQVDLSLGRFQEAMRRGLEARDRGDVKAGGLGDLQMELDHPVAGILFHDGNNRSMEQLMTDQARNALMHTVAIELLRKQYATMEMALRERVV